MDNNTGLKVREKTIITLLSLYANQKLTDFLKIVETDDLDGFEFFLAGPNTVEECYMPILDAIRNEKEYRISEELIKLKNMEDKYTNKTKIETFVPEAVQLISKRYLKGISEVGEKVDCTILLDKFKTIIDVSAFSKIYGALIESGMSEEEFTNCMMDESIATQMYLSARDRKESTKSYTKELCFIEYLKNTAKKFNKEDIKVNNK